MNFIEPFARKNCKLSKICLYIGVSSLARLKLSASCGGKFLNLVYRHLSRLSVPEVPATVPSQLQPDWLKI